MLAFLSAFAALFLSSVFLNFSNGLQTVVLPLRGSAEAFSTTAIGFIASGYSLGFIAGCLGVPLIIRRVGHIRTYAVLAAVVAIAVMSYVLVPNAIAWLALRTLSGVAVAGLFMVIESWLNDRAANEARARIFSVYQIVNYLANFGGQVFVSAGDPRGFGLFAACGAAVCAAVIPVGLTTAATPVPPTRISVRLIRLIRLSPVGMVGAFAAGMANSAFFSMGSIFAQDAGLALFQITLFTGCALLGGAATQWPLAMIADRTDRRRVIAGCMLAACLLGLVLAFTSGQLRFGGEPLLPPLFTGTALIVVASLYGFAAHPLYGLSAAHMNDFVERQEFVEASSGLLLAWAIGATIGPSLASVTMQAWGAGALFLITAGVHATLFAFTLYRMSRRDAPAETRKTEFVPSGIAKPSPTIGELDPRASRDE